MPSARADNAPSFTFTIAGDYGGIKSGSNGQKVANGIAAQVPVPNFHIAVGDLGYNAQNPTNWCASFKSIYPSTGSGSLVLVAGNHDTWNGGSFTYVDNSTGLASDTLTSESGQGFLDTASGYISQCGPPNGINWVGSGVSYGGAACQAYSFSSPSCYGREYYFDYPSLNPIMRFIFISAGIGGSWVDYSSGTSHYNWLRNRIDEAKGAGFWVAVVAHKNCISDEDANGIPDCASTFDPFNLAMTENVDLWLDGHAHSYERSYQLKPPCSIDSITHLASCTIPTIHPTTGYVRGQGTVVSIVGTGGMGNDAICNPNPLPSNCPNQGQFAKLCGSNGVVANLNATNGCNNDYGFSYFSVSTGQISSQYISVTGSFADTYTITVNNPPGDFSVSGSASLDRGVMGGVGAYSDLGTINVNSFGSFSNGVSLTLGNVSGGPSGTCPGTNCPRRSLSPTTITPSPGGHVSSTLTISTNSTTPCGNPEGSPANIYKVTVTATSGPISHQFTILLYVYRQTDVNKDNTVNIVDLVLVAGNFGKNTGDPGFNPNMDLNNDGHVGIADLSLIAGTFGKVGCS